MFILYSHSPNLSNEFAMVYIIKESLYIEFNDIMQMGDLQQPIRSIYGIFHRTVRTKTIAIITKLGFTYRLHDLLNTLLYQPVPNTWDSKGPC